MYGNTIELILDKVSDSEAVLRNAVKRELIAKLENSIEKGCDLDYASWGAEAGVLLTPREALLIVKYLRA